MAGWAGRRAAWAAAIPLVALLGTLCLGWFLLRTPLNPSGAAAVLRVERGETFAEVRRALLDHDLISPHAPIGLWGRITGKDRRIKSGDYRISPAQSPAQILDLLVAGRGLLVSVTIPEGRSQERILGLLARDLEIPDEELQGAAADSAWVRGMGLAAPELEGYLFPETYRFERRMAARRVLEIIVRQGLARFEGRRRERADSLGLSLHEVLTLASIVEAEAGVPEERARIAAVYHNRLARGWLLQADPTVAYALRKPAARLSRDDLEVDTPYNTYIHGGLPPGPICSPGIMSIDAALWPLQGSEDLYFVARGDGTHVFSRSLEDHNRARSRVRTGR